MLHSDALLRRDRIEPTFPGLRSEAPLRDFAVAKESYGRVAVKSIAARVAGPHLSLIPLGQIGPFSGPEARRFGAA